MENTNEWNLVAAMLPPAYDELWVTEFRDGKRQVIRAYFSLGTFKSIDRDHKLPGAVAWKLDNPPEPYTGPVP